MDPLYFMYRSPESAFLRVLLQLIRFGLSFWTSLECTRIYSVFLTFELDTTVYNIRIIRRCLSERNLKESLRIYEAFQVIVESGRAALRRTLAIMVFDSCILMIVLNYLILKCSSLMPLSIYACSAAFDIIIAMGVHTILPITIEFYESTRDRIERGWRVELLKLRQKISWVAYKELQRRIRSQRPVTFYYGVGIFESSTRENMYRNILDQTLSLVLM